MKSVFVPLQNRSLISIDGEDVKDFLQGIITNDINKVSSTNTIYACLLTPQGKYLADFFISLVNDTIHIDCPSELRDGLIRRLNMYKLRSKITINKVDKFEVVALLGDNVFEHDSLESKNPGETIKFCKGIAYIDPRTVKMFGRAIVEKENEYQSFYAKEFELSGYDAYEGLRIDNTIPEYSHELIPEGSFPLQNRLDELNAIDFDKGCYVGQEVTARSKHRGNIRKNLFTIVADRALNIGSEVLLEDSKVGIITSAQNDTGIAMLEVEKSQENLVTDGVELKEVKFS